MLSRLLRVRVLDKVVPVALLFLVRARKRYLLVHKFHVTVVKQAVNMADHVATSEEGLPSGGNERVILVVLSIILVLLVLLFIVIVWPTFMHVVRALVPVSKKQLARRKRTIQAWTVTKVSCLCSRL